MVMSGVDDGLVLRFSAADGDGLAEEAAWVVRMGRRDDNDVCLRHDTYSSRYHARLYWKDEQWWLEDCSSKNGTYVEDEEDDARVDGTIPIETGQLFRVGRTWLRIQQTE
jgi:pSer/pThr/pTyr-binding forkhead associated (FHA) protein